MKCEYCGIEIGINPVGYGSYEIESGKQHVCPNVRTSSVTGTSVD